MKEKKNFEKIQYLEQCFEKINQTEELAFSCHFTEACIHRFFDVCTALRKMSGEENCLKDYEERVFFWRVKSSHLHWSGFHYYRSLIPGMIRRVTEQTGFEITWPYPLAVERRELELEANYEHLAEERTYYETAVTALILLQDAKKQLKRLEEMETALVQDALFRELNSGGFSRMLDHIPSERLPEDADMERKRPIYSVYCMLLFIEEDLRGILSKEE